jgi:ribokinase
VRLAVVGHVEWIDFLRVERVPAQGEIIHASRGWGDAAGGGAVAAVQLANLAGKASFFTTFGADERGRLARRTLEAKNVRVFAREIELPQRYGVTFVDDEGERTITVVGERLTLRGADPELPWEELDGADGVYFVSGDAETVRRARKARVLVAATRSLAVLKEAGVELDAVVGSAFDAGESYRDGELDPAPRLVVRTEGSAGGTISPGSRYEAVEPPGPIVDSYGCGDCFAAGLTYGLAAGMPVAEAALIGARCGATVLTGNGPYERQYRLDT